MQQRTKILIPIAAPRNGVAGLNTTELLYEPITPAEKWEGDTDILCPHCDAVVAAGVKPEFSAEIKQLQCYRCRKWSTGVDGATGQLKQNEG